jgi:hypothetical protein
MMLLQAYLLTTVLSRYRHYILHLVSFYTLPHHLLLITSYSSPLVLYLLYCVNSYSFFPLPSSPSTLSLTLVLFSITSYSSPHFLYLLYLNLSLLFSAYTAKSYGCHGMPSQ